MAQFLPPERFGFDLAVIEARPDLVAEGARVLGFDRTGNGLDRAISEQIEAMIEAMIEAGEVETVGNSLRPALADAG